MEKPLSTEEYEQILQIFHNWKKGENNVRSLAPTQEEYYRAFLNRWNEQWMDWYQWLDWDFPTAQAKAADNNRRYNSGYYHEDETLP